MSRFLPLLIAMLLLAALLSPDAGAADKRTETLQQARQRATEKDYGGAITLYHRLLKKNPSDDEARNALGFTLGWAGRYEEAEAAFRKVLQHRPDDRDALYGIASLHYWQGDLPGSREALGHLLETHPGDGEAAALKKKIRRAELSKIYFRLRTAYRLEDYSFAPTGHGTNILLSYVRKKEWSIRAGGQYLNKFGYSDPGFKLGGSLHVTPSTVLSLDAEIAPKQVVIPRQAYTFEIDQTVAKKFVPFFIYRFADYATSDTHAFKPGLTWYLDPRLQWRVQYGFSFSKPAGNFSTRHSVYTMMTWNVRDPFDLFAGYAFGGENFESGNPVDPVGSFSAHTGIGGFTWEIAGRFGIDFAFSYENRDNGMTVKNFETGLSYRW